MPTNYQKQQAAANAALRKRRQNGLDSNRDLRYATYRKSYVDPILKAKAAAKVKAEARAKARAKENAEAKARAEATYRYYNEIPKPPPRRTPGPTPKRRESPIYSPNKNWNSPNQPQPTTRSNYNKALNLFSYTNLQNKTKNILRKYLVHMFN